MPVPVITVVTHAALPIVPRWTSCELTVTSVVELIITLYALLWLITDPTMHISGELLCEDPFLMRLEIARFWTAAEMIEETVKWAFQQSVNPGWSYEDPLGPIGRAWDSFYRCSLDCTREEQCRQTCRLTLWAQLSDELKWCPAEGGPQCLANCHFFLCPCTSLCRLCHKLCGV